MLPATMTDQDPHVTLVRREGHEAIEDNPQLPHEQLDVYDVLEDAYRTVMSWQGISWARGSTGDQLKRSASSAVLRYAEGYYADGGNKTTLWKGARASCGEAAAAIQLLVIDWQGVGGRGCTSPWASESRDAYARSAAPPALTRRGLFRRGWPCVILRCPM